MNVTPRFSVLLLLVSTAAFAQDKPLTTPTRDALIGYHLSPGIGEPIDVRVAVRAGKDGLRMDLPDYTYILVDQGPQKVSLVAPLTRTVVDLPWLAGPQSLFTVPNNVQFIRKTETSVANQRCTQWEAVDKARTVLCVTSDGLVLQNQSLDSSGRRNLIEAFVVRFETSPANDFAVPPGFEHLEGGPR